MSAPNLLPAHAVQAFDQEVAPAGDATGLDLGQEGSELPAPAARDVRAGVSRDADVVQHKAGVERQVRVPGEVLVAQCDLPPEAVPVGLAVLGVGLALRAETQVGIGRCGRGFSTRRKLIFHRGAR